MAAVSERKSDIWIGTGLLVFCVIAAYLTLGIKRGMGSSSAGPSMIPWIMIAGVAILSAVLIIRSSLNKKHAGEDRKIELPNAHTMVIFCSFVLLLIAYAAAFYPIGYVPATLFTFVVGLWLLGERRWTVLILFPIVMTSIVYLGFTQLLSVWLP